MLLVVAWLVIGGLGAPLPEDVALLAAGALVQRGAVSVVVALVVLFAGVIGGDVMLFVLARRLGHAAYDRPRFRRLLPPERRLRIEGAYRRHGGLLVFCARFLAGVRAGTFAMAGIHGMQLRRFVFWDLLAACISIPLIVGLGYLGADHLDVVRAHLTTIEHYALLAAIVGVIVWVVVWRLRRRGAAQETTAPQG
jgi:membrane protein DedA with SNARE-associated domain